MQRVHMYICVLCVAKDGSIIALNFVSLLCLSVSHHLPLFYSMFLSFCFSVIPTPPFLFQPFFLFQSRPSPLSLFPSLNPSCHLLPLRLLPPLPPLPHLSSSSRLYNTEGHKAKKPSMKSIPYLPGGSHKDVKKVCLSRKKFKGRERIYGEAGVLWRVIVGHL